MNCVNHPETAATAYCRTCGKALCASCARDIHGVIYCEECLAARVEGQPAATAAGQRQAVDDWVLRNTGLGPAPASSGPNPTVAGILSIVPLGVGAMYCGEFTRALVQAGVFIAICSIGSTLRDPGSGILGGLGVFWYVFMIVDSVRVAKAKQRGEPVPDLLGMGLGHPSVPVAGTTPAAGAAPSAAVAADAVALTPHRHLPIGPILLIGLGILFMLNVSNIWDFSWDRTWPLIVIGVGVWMLFSRLGGWSMTYGRQQGWNMTALYRNPVRLMGPAMVITTGVLGLLDEYSNWGWGRTWPLYLIVAGAIKMLQFTGGESQAEPPVAPPSAPAAESQVDHG